MKCYFEKRAYTRQEIAELLELDPHDKNFSRSVKKKLEGLGFTEEQYIYTSKNVVILWVPQSYEERITYLVRLLGIDKRVDPLAFATFLYHLALNGKYECDKIPWAEKVSYLKNEAGLNISETTLRKWVNKLLEKGILTKEKMDYQWWCSMRDTDDKIIRFPVVTEEEEALRKDYFDYCSKVAAAASHSSDPNFIYKSAWNHFRCRYYKCASVALCAWEENPIMKEIRDLILEHFNK